MAEIVAAVVAVMEGAYEVGWLNMYTVIGKKRDKMEWWKKKKRKKYETGKCGR